jgi:hypothetical protein
MTLIEFGLLVTPALAIVGAAAAIIRDRRKPAIDSATAKQIESVARDYSNKFNAQRDLRQLQVENWAFNQVMPWGRTTVAKFDKQGDQVRELARALGREVEPIHLDPFPEMPPPLLPTD